MLLFLVRRGVLITQSPARLVQWSRPGRRSTKSDSQSNKLTSPARPIRRRLVKSCRLSSRLALGRWRLTLLGSNASTVPACKSPCSHALSMDDGSHGCHGSMLRAPFSIPSPWCVAHLTAPRHPVRDFHYPILCDPELMAPCMPARFANVPGGWPQVALYRGPALTFWLLMSPLRRLESARSPLASGLYIQGQGPMRLGRPRPFLRSSLQTLNLDSNLTISLFDFSSDQQLTPCRFSASSGSRLSLT